MSHHVTSSISSAFEAITAVERALPVWSWRCHGVAFWPMLRIVLWQRLLEQQIWPSDSHGAAPPPARPPVVPAASPPVAPPRKLSAAEYRAEARRAIGRFAAPCRILLIAREEDAIDLDRGRRRDRMIDPLVDIAAELGYPALKVVVGKGHGPAGTSGAEAPDRLPRLRPDAVGNMDLAVASLPGLDDVLEFLGRRGLDLKLKANDASLRSQLVRLIQRAAVFDELMDACRPDAVFLAVFDDPMQMAAVHAFRRRGITVVDLQHGKQGADHIVNLPWVGLPPDGSNLLPSHFWVWTASNAEWIRQAMGSATSAHQAVVGGNPWLAYGVLNGPLIAAEHAAFFDAWLGFRKRILVTLQPLRWPLNDALLDAMRRAPCDWVWWIRLHRKQIDRMAELSETLASTGARFEIAESTRLPLYALLAHADWHATAYSTVAFEAEAFRCPTVLFHGMSSSVLPDEIAEGRFALALEADRLLEILSEDGKEFLLGTGAVLEADWDKAKSAMIALAEVNAPLNAPV